MNKLTLPAGKNKCVTLSFDDQITQDFRLVEIINKYGLKCTFNLNSGTFELPGEVTVNGVTVSHNKISAKEAVELYKGHEVAAHTVNHPDLCKLSEDEIIKEVKDDMKALSDLFGYDVCGMAYPYGTYNDEVVSILKKCGIKYSRTVVSSLDFKLPEDFLMWHSTMHFADEGMMDIVDKFLNDDSDEPKLLYIWGHSYELEADNNWELFEEFCKKVSGRDDTVYATNMEVYKMAMG
ncbi:MAG: polysaccharide deacetylase family protein [Lachnospiraceae bacterium]|nr:polysaccharide deacetylase family protein [Lachnospiraceae bacterium]